MTSDTEWNPADEAELNRLMELVLNRRRFWPGQRSFDLNQLLNAVPSTEVAVVNVQDQKLLAKWRNFEEWPKSHRVAGWYLLGGFMVQSAAVHESCLGHLRKDLRAEYKRLDIAFDTASITISEPLVIGVRKWKPGEHPTGCPLSMTCVVELTGGSIVETDRLKWTDEPIPTDVPCHFDLQQQVFHYLRSSPGQQEWMQEMADIGYGRR
jgi:hypothetical protein